MYLLIRWAVRQSMKLFFWGKQLLSLGSLGASISLISLTNYNFLFTHVLKFAARSSCAPCRYNCHCEKDRCIQNKYFNLKINRIRAFLQNCHYSLNTCLLLAIKFRPIVGTITDKTYEKKRVFSPCLCIGYAMISPVSQVEVSQHRLFGVSNFLKILGKKPTERSCRFHPDFSTSLAVRQLQIKEMYK